MARIIEYGDSDFGGGGGSPSSGYGGGTAVVAVLIILLLYLGGFFPWIMNLGNSFRNTGPTLFQQPVQPIQQPIVETRPIRPIVPAVVSGGGNVAYVIADNLNMRVSPNEFSQASYILPRGTRVEYLGESYQEPDGDFWVKVRIQSAQGAQIGWVSRRYIS